MHVHDVNERKPRFTVRRVFLPARGIESFTVIGPDLRPVGLVDEYLAWLTDCERSPNTVEAYAHDLRAFWTFLAERGLRWDRVGVMELGEFAAWARRPAENVVVLAEEAARLSARTVNRMLSGVVGFYEFQARRGGNAGPGSGREDAQRPRGLQAVSARDRARPSARPGGASAGAAVVAEDAVA